MNKVNVGLFAFVFCSVCSIGFAQTQSFSQNLFQKKSHDFGTVARAASIDYVFEFKNTTKNNIEMSSVRTSCNCTTPTIEKKVIKPGETGGVRCKFNTRSFLGARRATVTVTFSRPYFAEVQLEVKGYVRRDIVVHPPAIDFKNVNEGTGASKKVAIEYAGNNSWQISSAKSTNPDIDLELKETHRGKSLVGYELLAKLKPGAKPGYLNNFQVMLTTNDKRLNKFPISIIGKVEEAISISPRTIDVSEIRMGETVSKKLIIKGTKPFQIVSAKSSDGRVDARVTSAKKKIHIVPITFRAGDKQGPLNAKMEITTDLGGVKKTIDLTGNVIQ